MDILWGLLFYRDGVKTYHENHDGDDDAGIIVERSLKFNKILYSNLIAT